MFYMVLVLVLALARYDLLTITLQNNIPSHHLDLTVNITCYHKAI